MTREDYLEWKRDPRTEAWLREVQEEEIFTALAEPYVDLDSCEKTAMKAAFRAGVAEGITRCVNFVPQGAQT